MTWKYAGDVSDCPGCPPKNAKQCTRDSFRFVYDDINHPENFMVVAKKTPNRKLDGPYAICMAHALSLYSAEHLAIKRYQELKGDCKNIRESIGTHLAKGTIGPTDGFATDVQSDGHFSLFEAKGSNVGEKFAIICQIT